MIGLGSRSDFHSPHTLGKTMPCLGKIVLWYKMRISYEFLFPKLPGPRIQTEYELMGLPTFSSLPVQLFSKSCLEARPRQVCSSDLYMTVSGVTLTLMSQMGHTFQKSACISLHF